MILDLRVSVKLDVATLTNLEKLTKHYRCIFPRAALDDVIELERISGTQPVGPFGADLENR